MKKFLAIILIATTLLSSCATQSKVHYISCYDEYCQRYIGKSHKQLISDLGAPNRETSDGDGGTIIIYETITEHHKLNFNANTYLYAPAASTNGNIQGTTSSSISFLHLYIDSEGVCYNVDTNHMQIDWVETVQKEKREKEQDPKKKKTLAIVFGSMAAVFAVACGVGAIAFSR